MPKELLHASRRVRLVALEAIPVLLGEIKKEGERLLKAIDKAEKAAGETLMGRPEKIHVVRSRSDKPKSKTIHVCPERKCFGALDTTSAQTVKVTITMNSASSSVTTTQWQMVAERLN